MRLRSHIFNHYSPEGQVMKCILWHLVTPIGTYLCWAAIRCVADPFYKARVSSSLRLYYSVEGYVKLRTCGPWFISHQKDQDYLPQEFLCYNLSKTNDLKILPDSVDARYVLILSYFWIVFLLFCFLFLSSTGALT